jgi:hypothetical protein
MQELLIKIHYLPLERDGASQALWRAWSLPSLLLILHPSSDLETSGSVKRVGKSQGLRGSVPTPGWTSLGERQVLGVRK